MSENMTNNMFCYQCQETAGNKGCTKVGVCGKSADLANMQDLLIYVTKGLSEVTTRLRQEGKTISKEVNHYVTLNLFTTITNANFDDDVFYARVKETLTKTTPPDLIYFNIFLKYCTYFLIIILPFKN